MVARRGVSGERFRRSGLLLLALLYLSGCEIAPEADPGPSTGVPQANAGYVTSGLVSIDPPPPAPPSVIDPMDPWSAMGPLSGRYRLTVDWIEDDCTFGPDVPLPSRDRFDPSPRRETQDYVIRVAHRGRALGFELSEGVVFANYDEASGRLIDVERVGAEGVTTFLDPFAVQWTANGPVIQGESRWTFVDGYYLPGEECSGRTRWLAERFVDGPASTARDLQIVLRWPITSDADLDLTVESPGPRFWEPAESQADFVNPRLDCYTLHAAGGASPDYPDFVAGLDETNLPYHEEVVRCEEASWGWWSFYVTNWSATEDVDYELEVFWGPRVNTTRNGERSFGVLPGFVDSIAQDETRFNLVPDDDRGAAGIIVDVINLYVARRPVGPLTETHLEFNKAAFEGVDYDEFLEALGLR